MYKKIWITVILVILILIFSGSVAAKEALSVKVELKDGNVIMGEVEEPFKMLVKTKYGVFEIEAKDIVSIRFFTETPSAAPLSSTKPGGSTWNLQAPLILVSFRKGEEIKGFNKSFWGEPAETLHMQVWGRSSLPSPSEEDLQRLMESNTIFLVQPKGLEYLQDLEAKYPNLLPFSCNKLKSYPFPLFYFSHNVQTDRIRGVIIADKVDVSLAEILFKKDLPLNAFLWYENGQLKEIKEK